MIISMYLMELVFGPNHFNFKVFIVLFSRKCNKKDKKDFLEFVS